MAVALIRAGLHSLADVLAQLDDVPGRLLGLPGDLGNTGQEEPQPALPIAS
jgi:hypothetical protein